MIAIDTNTLVYATADPPPADIVAMCADARNALTEIDRRRELAIPAMCVSEYLAGVEPARRAASMAWIEERFCVLGFSAACVPHAMEILAAKAQLRAAQAVPGATRQSVRVDSFILATVRAHGASLVTNDAGLITLANAFGVGVQTPAQYLAAAAAAAAPIPPPPQQPPTQP